MVAPFWAGFRLSCHTWGWKSCWMFLGRLLNSICKPSNSRRLSSSPFCEGCIWPLESSSPKLATATLNSPLMVVGPLGLWNAIHPSSPTPSATPPSNATRTQAGMASVPICTIFLPTATPPRPFSYVGRDDIPSASFLEELWDAAGNVTVRSGVSRLWVGQRFSCWRGTKWGFPPR